MRRIQIRVDAVQRDAVLGQLQRQMIYVFPIGNVRERAKDERVVCYDQFGARVNGLLKDIVGQVQRHQSTRHLGIRPAYVQTYVVVILG